MSFNTGLIDMIMRFLSGTVPQWLYKKMDEYLREEHGEKYRDEMEEDEEFSEECGYLLALLEN
jgi:hypothetical protein